MMNDFGIAFGPTATPLEHAEDWMLKPSFASRRLVEARLPLGAAQRDVDLWNKLFPPGKPMMFICEKNYDSFETFGVASMQSALAAKRHSVLFPLYTKFPNHVPFILLLSELHFLMHDTHGALELCKHAVKLQKQSSEPLDETLAHTVSMLGILAKEAEKWYPPDSPNVDFLLYSRPTAWNSSPIDSSQLVNIQERWEELKAKGDGAQEFARYAAVKSNELEGIFLLTGQSGEQIARCGLHADCIQGISKKSRHQNPDKIIAILENAQTVNSKLELIANGVLAFDDDFLRNSHAQLLKGDNSMYEIETNAENELVTSLIPLGKYRRVPCFVQHHNGNSETHFCLPGQLWQELSWFFEQAQGILNDETVDPYRASAWLQHSYLSIYPFGDGNGRLGRMISSIPLIKAGLPPVYVSLERKFAYFDALIAVDEKNDIGILADFLRNETFDALKRLLEYVPPPTRALSPRRRRGRIGRRWALEKAFGANCGSPRAGEEKKDGSA